MTKALLQKSDVVLIVDDEAFCRQLVVRYIRELGDPKLIVMKNGAEAFNSMIAISSPCRLIISDFNMPVQSGLELLKLVRTGAGGIPNDTPFLMLTGIAERAVVGAAVALDIDAFVVKPVSKVDIANRVERVLSEERTIKPPSAYGEIDVNTAFESLLRRDPVNPNAAKNAAKTDKPTPNGRRMRLGELRPGLCLAEEIRGPTGELLLASGVELTPRLIDRLRDMSRLRIPIEAVWVEP